MNEMKKKKIWRKSFARVYCTINYFVVYTVLSLIPNGPGSRITDADEHVCRAWNRIPHSSLDFSRSLPVTGRRGASVVGGGPWARARAPSAPTTRIFVNNATTNGLFPAPPRRGLTLITYVWNRFAPIAFYPQNDFEYRKLFVRT